MPKVVVQAGYLIDDANFTAWWNENKAVDEDEKIGCDGKNAMHGSGLLFLALTAKFGYGTNGQPRYDAEGIHVETGGNGVQPKTFVRFANAEAEIAPGQTAESYIIHEDPEWPPSVKFKKWLEEEYGYSFAGHDVQWYNRRWVYAD